MDSAFSQSPLIFRLAEARRQSSAPSFPALHRLLVGTRSSFSSSPPSLRSASISDPDPSSVPIDVCRDGGCIKRVLEPGEDTTSDAATPLPGDIVQVRRVRRYFRSAAA